MCASVTAKISGALNTKLSVPITAGCSEMQNFGGFFDLNLRN